MKSKSVAVLDIRSSEICAAVGERGVNNTFIIKSKYTCAYDGYAEGELLDVGSFNLAVSEVMKNTLSAVGERIRVLHVGVPGEFLKLTTADKVISFSSPKRIGASDMEDLVALAQPAEPKGYTAIKHSALYYILSDKRRVIDPLGAESDSLRGRFCFFYCRNAFIECLVNALGNFSDVTDLDLIPDCLAQSNYLIAPEQRDGYAVLFDLGYISSTYNVSCGNGLIFSESFSVGIGHVAALLMSELEIPFEVAAEFLGKVNLNAKEKIGAVSEVKYKGEMYSFATSTLKDLIREGLDGICETIEECRQSFTGKDLSGKPLLVTGEGLQTVRGTVEHLSSRLVTHVEIIAPKLPYYDKPHFSSLFSLLSAALQGA